MASSSGLIDDAPLTAFHKKLTLYSSGGPFIDGYAIAIIGFTWATMSTSFDVTTADKGMIAAAVLVGIFVGGGLFGWVTDKVGRHMMYILDLLALAVFSVGCMFATEVWQLILLRFLIGMAIGADYPIATSLLAEYLPAKYRGRMLGATFVVWAVGATAAPAVAMVCTHLAGDNAWRWMLASPAVFALVTLFLRLGTPESPRWLISKGRVEEADRSIKQVFGPDYGVEDLGEPEPAERATLRSVFKPPYLKRTLFVSLFWMCQVIPLLSIYSFSFDILGEVGITGNGAEVFLAALFVVGGIPGLFLVDRIGRKALLIYTFAGIGIIWGIAGLIPGLPVMIVFTAVCAFALLSGASNFLEIVYPNELFPTEVRATAVGIGTAASRIGAAVAVYLMPFALDKGVNWVLLAGAVISFVGLAVTVAWGVETAGRSLSEACNATTTSGRETVRSG
ncbi:MFS transporter [Mycolicibacterium nivoides]|uniref:MFS transporter n=1 Tax=Mycolicibacterium nivoides TaxID=2487344 RepID=UPI0008C66057|nr:MFS transporter [Mycolicibacterium nivoides]MBN3512629.1 MFS transporter [Mycolicibacterium septicum]SEP80438.1 MFS transporter, putative metabolite transport protein [Mycobacterium sp. 88mf]SFF17050.1 MFS transporter, putative metabolite transport protein [Mycobacterium sp. 455mf]